MFKNSQMSKAGIRMAKLEAVKITADGRRIPLGVLTYNHSNPIRQAVMRLFYRIQRWNLAR